MDAISDSQTNGPLPDFDPVAISKRYSNHLVRVSWVSVAREQCFTNIPLSTLLSETTVHPDERINKINPPQIFDEPVGGPHRQSRVSEDLDGTVSHCEIYVLNTRISSRTDDLIDSYKREENEVMSRSKICVESFNDEPSRIFGISIPEIT